MSTELERRLSETSTLAARGPTIAQTIYKMRGELERAAPKHFDADKLLRVALTTIRRTPGLERASTESLLGALMLSAQLGLEPGPLGHVYLTPRTIKGQTEVVFVVGYRGYIELAYRTGLIEEISAHVVWQGERFAYQAGDDERIEHVPRLDLDPKPEHFVAAYARARLKTGGTVRVVIGPRHITRARRASAAGDKGPWASDFEAMARKTAIRRLTALLPQSAELAGALAADETVTRDVVRLDELEPNVTDVPAEEEQAPSSLAAPSDDAGTGADEPGGQSAPTPSPSPSPREHTTGEAEAGEAPAPTGDESGPTRSSHFEPEDYAATAQAWDLAGQQMRLDIAAHMRALGKLASDETITSEVVMALTGRSWPTVQSLVDLRVELEHERAAQARYWSNRPDEFAEPGQEQLS